MNKQKLNPSNNTEYHLTSVNQSYCRCNAIWTFNTKTKELTKFVAEDRMGLGVKEQQFKDLITTVQMKKIGNKTFP